MTGEEPATDAAPAAADGEAAPPASPSVVRVVHGAPTDEELAAVVAVLAAASATPARPAVPESRSQWRSRGRNIRPAAPRGPDAWRASGLPR